MKSKNILYEISENQDRLAVTVRNPVYLSRHIAVKSKKNDIGTKTIEVRSIFHNIFLIQYSLLVKLLDLKMTILHLRKHQILI